MPQKKNLNPLAVFIIAAASLAVPLLLYAYNFRGLKLSNNQAHWAQFGDYLGGVTNPLLSFATIVILIYTIKIQYTQLSHTKEQLYLTREDLTLTREELALTRGELARTAKAASKQAEHFESEAKKRDVYRITESYVKKIEEMLSNEKLRPNKSLRREIDIFIKTAKLEDKLIVLKSGNRPPVPVMQLNRSLIRLKECLEEYIRLSDEVPDIFIKFYMDEYQSAAHFCMAWDWVEKDELHKFYIDKLASS